MSIYTEITEENKNKEEKILDLRKQGLSIKEISERLKYSKSTVHFYCKKNNFINNNYNKKISDNIIVELQKYYDECKSCNKVATKFNISKATVLKYIQTNKNFLTDEEKKNNNIKKVVDRRIRIKEKSIEYKGGKCCKCDYNKCISALCFHHIDFNLKDFQISGKTISWERIKNELDKCLLLCMNCHQEVHDYIKKYNIIIDEKNIHIIDEN